jgi:Ala-tRNA(Pro) deacylase
VSVQKLRDFLDKHNIQYVTSSHSLAYTAQETAAAAHIAGQELAKTVMVKIEDNLAMAVVPASFKVNLDLLRKATGANKVELAHEQEFGGRSYATLRESLWNGGIRGRKLVPRRRDCV